MKTKIILILIISYQLSIINCFGQGFNYVGPNNDFGVRHSGVKVIGNKIFSQSVTVNYNDSIAYVGLTRIVRV